MYSPHIMADIDTKRQLNKARQELADLILKREQIEIEIAKQKRKVAAWAELCDESEVADAIDLDLGGLADACRTVLRASRKEWMTVADIMGALKELGFPLDKYKAPAASVTTTVNRLAEDHEVVVDRRSNPGATEYKWVGQAMGRVELLRRGEELLRGRGKK
jgi:hypothetical protein